MWRRRYRTEKRFYQAQFQFQFFFVSFHPLGSLKFLSFFFLVVFVVVAVGAVFLTCCFVFFFFFWFHFYFYIKECIYLFSFCRLAVTVSFFFLNNLFIFFWSLILFRVGKLFMFFYCWLLLS